MLSREVDHNPFSPEAIAEQSTRRFTTDADRAQFRDELELLRRDGYVIIEGG